MTNFQPKIIWITGLSGAGKTTLAKQLEKELIGNGISCFRIDGDEFRKHYGQDLGFSHSDRMENLNRAVQLAKRKEGLGFTVLCAFITPLQCMREHIIAIIGKDNYVEIYVSTPMSICESRDSKGLYKKAREGRISHFTGISSPYEPPQNPSFQIDLSECDNSLEVGKLVQRIIKSSKR